MRLEKQKGRKLPYKTGSLSWKTRAAREGRMEVEAVADSESEAEGEKEKRSGSSHHKSPMKSRQH